MKANKFSQLKIGDKFECYGDTFLNYNYPKVCQCTKIGETEAEEIEGIRFQINPNDEVLTENDLERYIKVIKSAKAPEHYSNLEKEAYNHAVNQCLVYLQQEWLKERDKNL